MRAVAAVFLALGMGLAGPSARAVDVDRDKPAVLHRIVWAEWEKANPGIHIRSMERDGSDLRNAYDWPHGFTLELSLDPAGRKVAFAPCCRSALPLLVVAPVLGGQAREPLRKKPSRFDFIGAVGWSPNSRRIVFEGVSGPAGARVPTIWTVRPNGKGLRKVLVLPPLDPDSPSMFVSLAWTSDGILYTDGTDLRSARGGHSTLVMRNVGSVDISGDGTRLVLERLKNGTRSLWMSDPDGTHRRKLLVQGDPQDGREYHSITPSYDASELLAVRRGPDYEEALVTWRVSHGPDSAVVLELPDPYTIAATWN